MRRAFARWQALPRHERRLLATAFVGLPVIDVALRVRGLATTRASLERWSARTPTHVASADELEAGERIARLAAIAGRRGIVPATCLRQALFVLWLLRRRGLRPELRIGVRRSDEGVDAHAWVELEGRALGQDGLGHVPFALPDGPAATSAR